MLLSTIKKRCLSGTVNPFRILMVVTKLAFLFLHYDVRIKGYDLKFRKEKFEYAYFTMMKKKQGVKFSS